MAYEVYLMKKNVLMMEQKDGSPRSRIIWK